MLFLFEVLTDELGSCIPGSKADHFTCLLSDTLRNELACVKLL